MKKVGRYEIVEELGRGAMGVVYKAADPTLSRFVALKVLSLQSSSEPGVPGPQDIFMREARAAGRLAHPSIVTIHDAFEDAETKSSCIVMELVSGRTLEKMVLSGLQFSVEETLEIVRQVAEGLDYAHRHEVIHRDLKPANILFSEEGRAKLTDFGIAKIIAREGALRTAALMGTPSYMSPEQVTGKDVDARSDLFSLGIIFFLMLTGQKPFSGETAAVLFKIVYVDPVPPSKLNPKLLPAHDYLVLRLLAKNRDKRYASARQFLDDLDDVRSGRPPRSEVDFPASELSAGEQTLAVQPIVLAPREEAPPPNRSARWAAAGLGVALLIVGGAVGVGVWKYRHPKVPPPSVAQATPQPPVAPQTTAPSPNPSVPQPTPAAPVGAPSGPPALRQAQGSEQNRTAQAAQSAGRRPLGVSPGKPETLPATPRAPATQPARGSSAPAPANPAPASIPAPVALFTATGKPASAVGKIQLSCRHELKEGKLSVSNGAQEIFQSDLKGRKKGGFHHLTGGYEGFLTYTLTVPADTRDLNVRITSSEAGIDLSNTIAFTPPAGSAPVLDVLVKRNAIQLSWRTPAPSKP